MFKMMKKIMLLIEGPASNPVSCHLCLKKDNDCLQTWLLLKAGDRKDSRGLSSHAAYADSTCLHF